MTTLGRSEVSIDYMRRRYGSEARVLCANLQCRWVVAHPGRQCESTYVK
jgi:hypothetical protein